jgi:hypothetical protein
VDPLRRGHQDEIYEIINELCFLPAGGVPHRGRSLYVNSTSTVNKKFLFSSNFFVNNLRLNRLITFHEITQFFRSQPRYVQCLAVQDHGVSRQPVAQSKNPHKLAGSPQASTGCIEPGRPKYPRYPVIARGNAGLPQGAQLASLVPLGQSLARMIQQQRYVGIFRELAAQKTEKNDLARCARQDVRSPDHEAYLLIHVVHGDGQLVGNHPVGPAKRKITSALRPPQTHLAVHIDPRSNRLLAAMQAQRRTSAPAPRAPRSLDGESPRQVPG